MVAAREKFLGGRHFVPLAETIVDACRKHAAGARFIMGAGAGIGYYIAHVLEALPLSMGLALDLSKFAARVRLERTCGSTQLSQTFWRHYR